MNHLVRSLLGPFASAAAGAIIGILLAIFVFGIRDESFVNGFALIGAVLGAAPNVLRAVVSFAKVWHELRGKISNEIEPPVNTTEATRSQQTQKDLAFIEHEARRKLLAAEHEARRPICTHCSKKTEPVFRYQKIDGGPDRRYHNNPLLCNRCFQPYAGVRPWNLPNADSKP